MAAVRSLQVSVKPDIGSDRSESDSESEPDRDPREPEPMEVEEGELESISVQRSLKDLLPDTSRRYENKAGTFITGIDVTSKRYPIMDLQGYSTPGLTEELQRVRMRPVLHVHKSYVTDVEFIWSLMPRDQCRLCLVQVVLNIPVTTVISDTQASPGSVQ
ncbi:UNVERIFIED_CONTAM: hypothetical protein FKN15_064727 [Acipenser sinensis]